MSEYIMERFHRNVSEAPNAPLFYDDTHPNGITFRQFDEMSARVYGWLKKQGIGREDFVLIHLPRGLTPFAVAAGIDRCMRLSCEAYHIAGMKFHRAASSHNTFNLHFFGVKLSEVLSDPVMAAIEGLAFFQGTKLLEAPRYIHGTVNSSAMVKSSLIRSGAG